jgi:gamma-glutamylcyclotransferase (GGCT)/AIG2-like uncharacterized protein YtfP
MPLVVPKRLFVCGSLRRGELNHARFEGFGDVLVATGTIGGAVLKDLGAYPAMIPSGSDRDRVAGEVYEIPDGLAETIDRFERDEGFESRPVTVAGASGTRLEAEAYFFAKPDRIAERPTVEDGDWSKHDHSRPLR